MRRFLNITRALADESRVRALLALRAGELCVCQLIDLLELAPSTVSRHMSLLVQAELVVGRREGRWRYYRLPGDGEAAPDVHATLAWLEATAGRSPTARADLMRLKEICCRERKEVSACCYGK